MCNYWESLITRLSYAFAWSGPGYDIKRPGKYWFIIKFPPGLYSEHFAFLRGSSLKDTSFEGLN